MFCSMRHVNKETSMAVGGITLSRKTAKIKTIRGGTKTETVLDSWGVIAVGRQHNAPSLLQHLWAMNDRASRAFRIPYLSSWRNQAGVARSRTTSTHSILGAPR